MTMNFLMLAFYKFTPLEAPKALIKNFKCFFENLGAKGRVYISEEGINGQMSVCKEDLEKAKAYLNQIKGLEKMSVKLQPNAVHGFEKLIIKYREHLVGLKDPVDLSIKGDYLSPEDWKALLESNEDKIVIDGRNDYEWEVGHFKGAEKPPCRTFRDFPDYIKEIKEKHGTNKKVMMSCTGGIRCELLSSMMIKEGFSEVYQLEGGVINYGNTVGSDGWEGKLFVFDDRMAVPLEANKEPEPISSCSSCDAKTDTYYNCANMDCNKLFLACPDCIEAHQGCCSEECMNAPRLRAFEPEKGNRPFRKWYRYFQDKSAS